MQILCMYTVQVSIIKILKNKSLQNQSSTLDKIYALFLVTESDSLLISQLKVQ